MRILTILLFLVLNISFNLYPQSSQRLDSLLVLLSNTDKEEDKLSLLIELSGIYNRDIRSYDKCIETLERANAIAVKDSNLFALSKIYGSYGVLYRNSSGYEKAIEAHTKALHFAQRINDKTQQASTLNNIGVVYRRMDKQAIASQYHIDALKIAEEIKDNYNISVSLNSLGNIYSLSGMYAESIIYFRKALALSEAMGNKLGVAINLNNIGEVYEFLSVPDSALYYYSKSLEANKAINSQKGIGISYNAVGKIKLIYGQTTEAYSLFVEALRIDKKLGDKKFIADSYINLGKALLAMKRFSEAEEHLKKGISIAQEIGSTTHCQWGYEALADVYAKTGNANLALSAFRKSVTYKDSVINLKNSRAIAVIEVMYKTQKKQQEIELLTKSQEVSQKELARQRVIQVLYLIGFLFSFFAVIAIYLALKVKRKANSELQKQKEEIEKSNRRLNQQQDEILKKNEEINIQRNNISQKNKNLEEAYSVIESYIGKITDNIRYAERIQKAILTPVDSTKPFFSDSFCLYLPKDFVSGDFYWLNSNDDSLFIAAADCTGHGVPGAFMSIIGLDILNQAVIQQHIKEPSDILDFLNIEIRKKLRKDDEEVVLKDSMDIAICRFDAKTQILHYSGALIPLLIIRNGELIEHKASPISIGISASVYSKRFDQKAIQLLTNDWVYFYSDGFADQFGGTNGSKFLRKRFYSTLANVSQLTGKKQQDELTRAFVQWKGNTEQVDDVLVLGFKV